MSNSNTSSEYKQLNSKFIVADNEYQRVIDARRVNKIVSNFNADLVNPLKVSHRDGKYYVFDGQHTLATLKAKNGGKDLMVDCKVYEGLTKVEEAKLFTEQNGISRTVKSTAKFRALQFMGDVDICEMVTLTAAAGFCVDFKDNPAGNHIVAVTKLFKMFKNLSGAEFTDALSIIREAWGGVKESVCTEMLGGMYLFYRTYKGRFKRDKLVERLAAVSPKVLVREGKAFSSGGDLRFARQILAVYNKNTSTGRLPDDLN